MWSHMSTSVQGIGILNIKDLETVEKRDSKRLMENVHMQGFRNPEERGVHRSTPQ